jgi:hypothetical protein
MNEINKESYRTLLSSSREVNEDMINYWSEKIILKALEVNKPLNEVSILIE